MRRSIVRVAVDDEPNQVAIVRQLLKSYDVFISRTVLLETEWVLRSSYQKTQEDIARFFQALLTAQNTVIEDEDIVSKALEYHRSGADFADALHLGACGDAKMHTFDRNFCKTARKQGVAPAVEVLSAQ